MTRVRILRHYKENKRKCTLQPFVGDPRFEFWTWHPGREYDADGHTVLEIGAPLLTAADAVRPLFLLDSTWRFLPRMRASLTGTLVPRSLPKGVRTAYPRVARLSPNPMAGLASIEALYLALRMLGDDDPGLLTHYLWREDFLQGLTDGNQP